MQCISDAPAIGSTVPVQSFIQQPATVHDFMQQQLAQDNFMLQPATFQSFIQQQFSPSFSRHQSAISSYPFNGIGQEPSLTQETFHAAYGQE